MAPLSVDRRTIVGAADPLAREHPPSLPKNERGMGDVTTRRAIPSLG